MKIEIFFIQEKWYNIESYKIIQSEYIIKQANLFISNIFLILHTFIKVSW